MFVTNPHGSSGPPASDRAFTAPKAQTYERLRLGQLVSPVTPRRDCVMFRPEHRADGRDQGIEAMVDRDARLAHTLIERRSPR